MKRQDPSSLFNGSVYARRRKRTPLVSLVRSSILVGYFPNFATYKVMALLYCSPRHTISTSFCRWPSVIILGVTAKAIIIMVATIKTTISRVYPASFWRRVVGWAITIGLTGRAGFLQSQRCVAAGGNLFHIGSGIGQPNDAEPAQERVPFAGNDHVLIVGRGE